MSAVTASEVLSHWNHRVAGMQQSSNDFYDAIDGCLKAHRLGDVKTERVEIAEGGIFSGKREYLQVRRKEHVFHICAAPYGDGFFVSWWLGEVQSGLFAWLGSLPYIGFVFRLIGGLAKPLTYYRIDTALMFQSVTHGAVLDVLDQHINVVGLRALMGDERKPLIRDLFSRLGGGK